ncbi:glutathione S-transferase [alpha proteobacterium AAP81b]|nr:glutathione S-transferase [alpha proteobacterium AAP81b]
MAPLLLHEYSASGNCYKIRLTAAHLGLALERRQYDILKGETRTPEFLATVNRNGRIPVLQVGDRCIPESNAACWYLADGSALIPDDRFARADMLRWMFFEQYSHEPNVATLRFWRAFVGEDRLSDAQRAQIPAKETGAREALAVMDYQLARTPFLIGDAVSIADIALYAYTHVAEEGGTSLAAVPAVRAWLARVAALPGHIAITA